VLKNTFPVASNISVEEITKSCNLLRHGRLGVILGVTDGVPVGVIDGVADTEAGILGVILIDGVILGVILIDGVIVGVIEGVIEILGVILGVLDGVNDGVAEGDGSIILTVKVLSHPFALFFNITNEEVLGVVII